MIAYNKLVKYFFLVLLDIFFLFIIIFLSLKIRDTIQQKNILGIQNVTKLNKQNLIFDDSSKEYKYFYEPKPNEIQTWNPDWLGYTITYHINSDGLNEEKDYSIEKSPRTFRIITIGDSFTFGAYVNTKDNYSKVLELFLNNKVICPFYDHFEVINLGVAGYDISYTVKRFEKRGIKYNPDLVIWLLNSWNFELNELFIPIKNEQLKAGFKLFDPSTNQIPAYNRARQIIKQKYGNKYIFEKSKQDLLSFKNIYDRSLLIFSLGYLPQEQFLAISSLSNNSQNSYRPIVINYWDQNDLRIIDNHPNEKGHTNIANELFKLLRNNDLKGCKFFLT